MIDQNRLVCKTIFSCFDEAITSTAFILKNVEYFFSMSFNSSSVLT